MGSINSLRDPWGDINSTVLHYQEYCICGRVHRSIGSPINTSCQCGAWVSSNGYSYITSGNSTTIIRQEPTYRVEVKRRSRLLNLMG